MLYSKSLTDLYDPVKTELEHSVNNLYKNLGSDNPLIDRIISYIFSTGGKRIRPALSLLASKLFQDELNEKHFILAQVVEILHTATLVHDDVIDDAELRRGHKTVKALWDNKITVICGDYLLAKASGMIADLESLRLIKLFSNAISELCNGEIQQSNQLYDTSITWEDYILKSKRKTAILFASATQGAAIISKASEDQVQALYKYGLNYGLAFQIFDDVLNYSDIDQIGKPSYDDLKSGIITAPAIYAMEEISDLASKIDTSFKNETEFDEIVGIIKSSSGINKAIDLAQNHVDEAIKSLDIFSNSEVKLSLIQLAEYVTKRKY